MLYPNLQINIKKRGAGGLDDSSAALINTPVILDLAVAMSEDKNFSYQQPSLNQFKPERLAQDDKQHLSLQTPVLELNQHQLPFFSQSSSVISPSDNLNSFVSPNQVLNTYTTVSSSTSTSVTNAYNELNQTSSHMSNNLQMPIDQSHHPLSLPSKLLLANKQQQESNIHQHQQNDYHQFNNTDVYTSSAQSQVSQYLPTSDLLNHQTELNDNNLNAINHSHLSNQQDQQHNAITYTELKPSASNELPIIPNSVFDITGGYKKHHHLDQQPPSYHQSPSPCESSSSSTMDRDQDSQYGESISHHRRSRPYPGQSAHNNEPKKSRMTKKQKYDAMINEEKSLLKNNEQLKTDIKNLEDMIIRYKSTIMNTVKNNNK